MEHFKTDSLYPLASKVIKILALFSLSASCFARPVIPTKTSSPSKAWFTFNKPVNFNWTGPSLGGYIGGGWGDAKVTTTAGSVSATSYFPTTEDINAVTQMGSQTFIPSAFIGGVQLHDNWMYKNFVYGFVLDYGSFSLGDKNAVTSSAYPDGSGNFAIKTAMSTDWMYTIRGRLGWVPEVSWPVLIYGTGGLAVTNLSGSNQFSDTTTLEGTGTGFNSNTLNGWGLGFGVEFPIAQNLTINAEYLYANFGSVEAQGWVYNTVGGFGIDYQSLGSPLNSTTNLYANFLKVGLSYKFNPGGVPHDQK